MSLRALVVPTSYAVALVGLFAGPLAAQIRSPRDAASGQAAVMMTPYAAKRYVLRIQWSGSAPMTTLNSVVAFSNVRAAGATQGAAASPTAAVQTAGQPGVLAVTFSNDNGGTLAAWYASTIKGQSQPADLVLAAVGLNGAVERQCIYRHSSMSSWNVGAASSGGPLMYRAGFSYQSAQCSA